MPLDMSAIGREVGPSTVSWDSRDAMLYALGVGAGQADPYDELRFTTENSEGQALAVLPVYAVVLIQRSGTRAEMGPIDRTRLVHAEQGFVLHKPVGSWQSTLQVRNDIGLTTSKDILTALGQGEGPAQVLITIGYAGWSAGQIENEIRQNAWLTVDADAGTLFDTPPEGRMSGALGLLGIDLSRLSEQAGHA